MIIRIFYIVFFLHSCVAMAQPLEITWQNCFGGTNEGGENTGKDIAYDILEVENGYIIAGQTTSVNGDVSYNHGISDGWLVKIDKTGNLLWEKSYGGSKGDNFINILPATNGTFFVAGATNSGDGDISFDPYPGTWDHWFLKIDSNGNILWETVVGGNGDDANWRSKATKDGGILSIGWTGSQDGDISNYYGWYDMWIVKIDSNGSIVWDFTYGSANEPDFGQGIIETSDGGYLFCGYSTIGTGGNLQACVPNSHNTINPEALVVKLDSLRNIEWEQCFGGSDDDGFHSLLEVEDGYICSGFTYSYDGDVIGFYGGGHADIWTVKIDYFGNMVWQKCLGGTEHEITTILKPFRNNGVIVIGPTDSHDGDVTGNHANFSGHKWYDIWMIALDSSGELLWEQCIGGAAAEEIHFGCIQKDFGEYIITSDVKYGPSYDVECELDIQNSKKDYWVFSTKCKYAIPPVPDKPLGKDTISMNSDTLTNYSISSITGAQYYKWILEPDTAGTLLYDSTSASIAWDEDFSGIANLQVRSLTDCNQSEWSEHLLIEVMNCLGSKLSDYNKCFYNL